MTEGSVKKVIKALKQHWKMIRCSDDDDDDDEGNEEHASVLSKDTFRRCAFHVGWLNVRSRDRGLQLH